MTTSDQPTAAQKPTTRNPIDSSSCEAHLAATRAFADRVGLRDSLEECLERLTRPFMGRESRTVIRKDFAPYSFEFVKTYKSESGAWEYAYNGGIIYHGPHDNGGDGGMPTLSVNLEPHNGWSIHT